ncbi:MAG: NAD-dependent malic enzyme [Tepidanaerobacter acetatoxydans]|uniref:NADP-dependent malic enzyme (Conversion of malate into pyruvate) n=1 Tax=Tepidanaerobacter acetatoxydans (strain DSM 21804 / JCM 16047 / Re1) TaxID=1209989 RepID=F4LVC1_TEPAE|nr:malic enzyme-like NAD(P)-binding protein [Tepidanaerobacter acetatoxydans]AEE90696.1 Malate dehydrogenase (oxaloacetate-decarboxylating) (NADP(+)) [Tepidanaerobacter acetatoxydans Re1]NLU09476.1 NAD-dependent malic enzyme [Tepidanaerobacter acetatoxydans]CCP25232.1 NADP-dependent malic enzyme (conversion of malate into pyruvate) [Tepidanaerobacter acetatoxydans Re1]
MDLKQEALQLHMKHQGKIEVISKVPLKNSRDLSLAYTPGVAEPCKKIKENPDSVYEYTAKGRMVAVVTDGSAVLGLGNIGAEAGMPVMEGKAVLFKNFGGVDAFPICLDTQDVNEIVDTIKHIAPTFGGINLEDIAAPRCFEVEKRLKQELDIPVFHDDQHGTAVVVLAAIINALKIVKKDIKDVKVVISGAGAAGVAISKLLLSAGVFDVVVCDSKGIVSRDRTDLNKSKQELADISNKQGLSGDISCALKDSDIFIGVSGPGTVTKDMIKTMAKDAIIFALANPVPEIYPDEAKQAGAKVVGTGRSDYPNQINNVLAFPGIFRGALEVRASDINEEMKLAASYAIASLITPEELSPEYCIPGAFDKRVAAHVACEVAKAAMKSKVAKIKIDAEELKESMMKQ